jgi:signal transduction histidine kinase
MEEVANRVVRHLYEHLVDGDAHTRSCALVRFFKTHPYGALNAGLREFAQDMLQNEAPTPGMRCLTLLASAGDEPEWNSRRASRAHQAIPLVSREMVSQAPMISSLLQQLGVEVEALLGSDPGLLVESQPSSFNVFYVPEARESPYIPAQTEFVRPLGIRSVLGFGGMLPQGDIFVVILFSKVPIPRETAELFRTLALNVKMAALPFDAAVFRPEPGAEEAATRARKKSDVRGLSARIDTLQQLLDVYEGSVIAQAERLYAEQELLRFNKSLLESQGEASLDGILSVGTDGTILFANRRLSEMWSVAAPRIGKPSYAQVLRSLAERTADPTGFVERSAALDSIDETHEEVSLGDGRTFDQYAAPIRGPEGSCFGRVWHFRDITTFKEIGRMKDEFISAVSHELRTPLTSIRGSLDLMASGVVGELPSEASAMVKVAQNNCGRLLRLINDVLDIEKIEAGRMDFRLQVMELEPLLEQSVETIRPYGDQLGVGFRIESTAPGVRVRVDPDRLIQVLDNLLSNAAKFSPPREVVRVALARRGPFVRVSVTDLGPGVARDLQGRLFEKFAQGERGPRDQTGTGLGLNIARAIVERLGGAIGFVSKPGVGTTFHFDLLEWSEGRDREPEP